MVFQYHSDKKAWRQARVRISNGRYLQAIPLDVANPELRDADKLDGNEIDLMGEGIRGLYGNGIKGFDGEGIKGLGVRNMGGKGQGGNTLVKKYQTDPLYQSYGHLVVLPEMMHGRGIGSFLKKGLSRLLSFGKKKALPKLINVGKKIGKEALKSGKRAALDVFDDIGDDLVKAGVDAVGDRVGDNIFGDIAKSTTKNLGKRVTSNVRKQVEEQGPLSATEGAISEAVSNRSRELLSRMMKKNEKNAKRGEGIQQGVFKNTHFFD